MSHGYRACISHAPDARRMSNRRPSRVVVSGRTVQRAFFAHATKSKKNTTAAGEKVELLAGISLLTTLDRFSDRWLEAFAFIRIIELFMGIFIYYMRFSPAVFRFALG